VHPLNTKMSCKRKVAHPNTVYTTICAEPCIEAHPRGKFSTMPKKVTVAQGNKRQVPDGRHQKKICTHAAAAHQRVSFVSLGKEEGKHGAGQARPTFRIGGSKQIEGTACWCNTSIYLGLMAPGNFPLLLRFPR